MFRSSPLKYRHFSVFMFLAFSKNARKRKKKKLRLDSVSARLIVSHSIKELRKSNIRYFAQVLFPNFKERYKWKILHEKAPLPGRQLEDFPK